MPEDGFSRKITAMCTNVLTHYTLMGRGVKRQSGIIFRVASIARPKIGSPIGISVRHIGHLTGEGEEIR